MDATPEVTAKPETLNIFVSGLYTKVLFDEIATPEALPTVGVNKIG